ncbi:hypothetical protein [Clavibacter sp. VKM Ac-2872]|uniref:hypothetical protein n=1 Tax=Clavibacter sp. VKM Ac-2872 TaxID=2783812 RepID=UPI00188D8BF4|nr:hypothetical protein [Clavibacter sp. VKM Ac-2872]MBF4622898.1 hypothetical protein [Clavibacter sp. VKM Ac-2872]
MVRHGKFGSVEEPERDAVAALARGRLAGERGTPAARVASCQPCSRASTSPPLTQQGSDLGAAASLIAVVQVLVA